MPAIAPGPSISSAVYENPHRCNVLAHLLTSLAENTPLDQSVDRRLNHRTPFSHLLKLVPIDKDGFTRPEKQFTVVGRDVSARGLSFFHQHPIPYRRAIISLEHPQAGRISVEMIINRCRFHRLGWYESAGRLVRAIEFMLPKTA